jgi:hypothetical protein
VFEVGDDDLLDHCGMVRLLLTRARGLVFSLARCFLPRRLDAFFSAFSHSPLACLLREKKTKRKTIRTPFAT